MENQWEGPLLKRRKAPIVETADDEREELASIALDGLVEDAASYNYEIQLQAVQTLRKLLAERDPPMDELIDLSILKVLVKSLGKFEHPNLQFEAAWALTNIASGTTQKTQAVVCSGAVPLLLQLTHSKHPLLSKQAIWALGNIIADGPFLRDYVLNLGAVPLLLNFITIGTPIPHLRCVLWVVTNIFRNGPPPSTRTISNLLNALTVLIHHTDPNILTDTVRAISYLRREGQVQMVINSGVVPALSSLLAHNDIDVQAVALRALNGIVGDCLWKLHP